MSEPRLRADPSAGLPSAWRRFFDPKRRLGAISVYSIIAGVVCFWRLGATGLVSMEGMVVEGARHMLESGDWLVPRLYGELYTYKPALAYWLASLPLRLVESPSEGLLRLPFAACGFVMGLAVLLLIGRLAGWRAGLFSAVASVSGLLFLQKARMMEFDISLTAGVGVAVTAACYNLAASRQRWGLWLLGYLGLAVGLLTKGVPALAVFGPGLIVAALAGGRFRRLFGWRHLTAVLLFAAISCAYLWAAWESAGPAAFEQPLVEARIRGLGRMSAADLESLPEAERFVDTDDGRLPGWPERLGRAAAKPILIWASFLPWTILLFAARRVGWRDSAAEEAPVVHRLARAAAGFAVAGALVFMLIPTHETRYFLPLSVPIGILCGLVADRLVGVDRQRVRGVLGASVGAAVLVVAATAAAAFRLTSPPIPQGDRLVLALAAAAGAAAIVYLLRRRGGQRLILMLGVAAAGAMLTQYLGVDPSRAGKRNLKPQAIALAAHLPAGAPVWVLGPADEAGKHASLFFYLDRPVRAFRADGVLPGAGAPCLLTARDLDELAGVPGFSFREIARVEHVWFSYRLGACSEPG